MCVYLIFPLFEKSFVVNKILFLVKKNKLPFLSHYSVLKHFSMRIFLRRGENVSIAVQFLHHSGDVITPDTIYAMPAVFIIK